MINAGYKVFTTSPHEKAPMSAIADAAKISKSLLFHYLKNKKGLYLYLFELALKTGGTRQTKKNVRVKEIPLCI